MTSKDKFGFTCYETVGMGIINVAPTVRVTGSPEFLDLLEKVLEELGDLGRDPTPEEIDAAIKKVKE